MTYRCGADPSSCSYGSAYESAEVSCDGQDNDCDGVIDDVRGCLYTVAGAEPFGFSDGAAAAARFGIPQAVSFGPAGEMYVADGWNHAIRRIDTTGRVTTVVGNGTCGGNDGPVATARLCFPRDVISAANGDLFFSQNHSVRKISNGIVTTIAGSLSETTAGLIDALGTAARFNAPSQLHLLPNGDLLVADYANHRIRRVTPTGVVTTEAGSVMGSNEGNRLAMQLLFPSGVTAGPDGALYVVEITSHRIRKIPPSGTSSVFAGGSQGSADGPPLMARFDLPSRAIYDPGGAILVAATFNDAVRSVPLDGGNVTSVFRAGARGFRDGPLSQAQAYTINAVDIRGDQIAFVDRNANVRLIDRDAGTVTTVAGIFPSSQSLDGPSLSASMRNIYDTALSSDGGIFFSQFEMQPIRYWSASGVRTILPVGTETEGPLPGATSPSVVGAVAFGDERLFFMNNSSCRLRVIDFQNQSVQTLTGLGLGCDRTTAASGPFSTVRLGDVRKISYALVGGQPVLYLSQCAQGVLRIANLATGMITTLAGTFGTTANAGADGPPGTGVISTSCTELIPDGNGGAHFGDYDRIRHVSSAGVITTVASPNTSTIVGLARSGTRLYFVHPLGVSSFEPTLPGLVTRDLQAVPGYRDGIGSAAGVYAPLSIEITSDSILISDYYRLRRLWR